MTPIIFDLEWNQPLKGRTPVDGLPDEIIQIGAAKIDLEGNVLDTFSQIVKPFYYTKLNKDVAELTLLKDEDLEGGLPFAQAMDAFRAWCGEDYVLLSWSATDGFVMARNCEKFGYGTDWISGLEMDASSGISFSYTANGTGFIRKGTILITYTDGWGAETGITLYLTQDGTGASSRSISFTELRELATTEGTPIDQNLILEGLVAGNTASGNMGDNEQLTTINIDYTVSQRTIYLESKDASKGIRILADVPEDNPFSQGDLLKIDLKGTRLFKSTVLEERDPVYYYIEGFTPSNVTSRIPGGTLPEKKKAIGELTDDDIFTYTTLTQVELPIRKGPLTPLEEFYTNAGENHRCAKFPVLLRGKDGEHLYVFTNTTCPYRIDDRILI